MHLPKSLLQVTFMSCLALTAIFATAEADEPTGLELAGEAPPPEEPLSLWYRQPATKWSQALPIGNGRLGAMVFGGIATERLQFNEDTVWTGEPHEYQHEGAAEFLPAIRKLLYEGKQREAEELAMQEFMSEPLRQKAYQPCGDLLLEFPRLEQVEDYRRELNLDTAVASVSYTSGDTRYRREAFASYPDQAVVWHMTANQPGKVSFTARLKSPHAESSVESSGDNALVLRGHVTDGVIRFEARLHIDLEGGELVMGEESLRVEGADSATLKLVAATNFKSYKDVSAEPSKRCKATVAQIQEEKFGELLKRHLEDHQKLFRRVTLDLGTTPAAEQPTDRRVEQVDQRADPQLTTLYFQFGRYLLIASSRPGSQPANLQGIWNDKLQPPWDSKYTVNINTEMNYWPAEVCNLAECHEPLFSMVEDCVESGRKTARAHYDCGGWVLHHNTDLWRGTAPINHSNHGIWVTGGAWLTHHFWEHFLYSGDKQFLSSRAYPVMKEACQFFLDYLVRDKETGWLISGPSNSPEIGGLVMGPTMDHQIIRSLMRKTARAADLLEVDQKFAQLLRETADQIAPNQIGQHGQLQEWLEDKDDPRNQHRHVSHLWGLFPGSEITPRETPELAAAAKQSLLFRGDGGTGWSKAWKISFWSRFLDGDHAHKMIIEALAGNTYPNLLDAHPPFQIDGNFGGTAGIAEMLLQSHNGQIELLPALPSAWPEGAVSGLRARGGLQVSMTWSEGRLVSATLHNENDQPGEFRIRYADTIEVVSVAGDEEIELNEKLQIQR